MYNVDPLPKSRESLIGTASTSRPDLNSFRLGLSDNTNIVLVRERYSDVYLLYQPYTFQNNSYQGLKSAYSYAFGVDRHAAGVQPQPGSVTASGLPR